MDMASEDCSMVREECNLVFGDPTIANEHQENEKRNRIRQTEYLVTEHYYFF